MAKPPLRDINVRVFEISLRAIDCVHIGGNSSLENLVKWRPGATMIRGREGSEIHKKSIKLTPPGTQWFPIVSPPDGTTTAEPPKKAGYIRRVSFTQATR